MLDQDKILNFLKFTGPTIPAKVAKNIKSEILIASAHLSDLAAQGKVKISHLKIGGTPLYYLPGQEEQLYHFAAGNVNPKDVQVLEELKKEKVLRESELDLLSKVSLRSLKDFSQPLQVNIKGKTELFWKWRLLSTEETNQIIGWILSGRREEPAPEAPAAPVREMKPEIKVIPVPPLEIRGPFPTGKPEVKPALKKELKDSQKEMLVEVKFAEMNRKEEEYHEKEEKVEKEKIDKSRMGRVSEPKIISSRKEHLRKELPRKEKPSREKQEKLEPEKLAKKPFFQKVKERLIRRKRVEEEFLPQLEKFCRELNIEIEQKEIVRKNVEPDLLVKVPSVVGSTNYLCKAKSKSKCDEKDLSLAYMEAQAKKLPLLFLYTGELSKKAQEMIDAHTFENAIIKKIELREERETRIK